MPHNPGEIIDNKYRVIERLGAGGMGELYKAEHTWLGATRVIKVVHPQISANEDAHSRFLREGRAATKVQHPHVATLHDFSTLPDGSHYMVWEYIDGENLAQRLRMRGTLPPREAVRIVVQALHGLEAVHRAGIIHRDISPENLMITRDGSTVKIIDLGVAKLEDPAEVSSTQTGIFVGKLRYASPEQLGFLPEGEKIDARTDIYSVGMVLFELLTGRPPYEAKSPHEYFLLHAREEHQRHTVELPADMPGGPALRQVLDRALDRDRKRRFATAAEFASALEEIERTLPDQRSLATVEVPHADETMRVAPQTVRATRPAPPQAAPTVRTPMPGPMLPPAAPSSKGWSRIVLAIVAVAVVFVIAAGAIAAILFFPRPVRPKPEDRRPPIGQPRTQTTGTQLAEASVNVVGTGTTGTAPAATVTETQAAQATTTTAPPPEPQPAPAAPARKAPERREPETAAKEREPEPVPEPAQPAAAAVPAYVDGGGDEGTNERMLDQLRREMSGVRRVAVHGGAMQTELVKALKEELPRLEISDSAPVVIRFDGVLERLGRGRKRRAATATITKNGRVIFRYELPEEVFRVGMHPQEAFVHVLTDAVHIE